MIIYNETICGIMIYNSSTMDCVIICNNPTILIIEYYYTIYGIVIYNNTLFGVVIFIVIPYMVRLHLYIYIYIYIYSREC